MDATLRQYLGDYEQPFSFGEFSKYVDIHLGSHMIVLLPKKSVNLPVGTHVHSSYEFMLPLTSMSLSHVDGKPVAFEQKKLYPINAEQPHGQVETSYDSRFIVFQLEEGFVRSLAKELYGDEHLLFLNVSCDMSGELQHLLRSFVEESTNRQAGHKFLMDSISMQIAITLFRQLRHNMGAPLQDHFYTDKENIKRAIEFLMEYYGEGNTLEDVARIANLSTYHFIRVFKAETGKTPIEFLTEIKIDKAKSMLMNRGKSISEICYECGFASPSHFSRVFKSKIGVPPKEYRKSYLGIS